MTNTCYPIDDVLTQVPRVSSCQPFFGRQWSSLPHFCSSPEDIICIQMDAHHDVLIALLQVDPKTHQFGPYGPCPTICTPWQRCCSAFWWLVEVGSLCLVLLHPYYWCSNLHQPDSFLLPFHVSLLRFVQIREVLENEGCHQAGPRCVVSCPNHG